MERGVGDDAQPGWLICGLTGSVVGHWTAAFDGLLDCVVDQVWSVSALEEDSAKSSPQHAQLHMHNRRSAAVSDAKDHLCILQSRICFIYVLV